MSYLKIADLGKQYDFSSSTMYRLVREMVECGRYPNDTVIGIGKMRRVDPDAFKDFVINLQLIRHPTMRKMLGPYKRGGTSCAK